MTSLLAAGLTVPSSGEDVAATIIAMEKTALAQSDQGDAMSFVAISAADVVYQDPFLKAPLKGRDALAEYYSHFPQGDGIPGEMHDATVQQYGDIAILSFRYISHAGTPQQNTWNSTEVYRRTPEGWRIVNTHWSLIPKD